jgi:hypothetical protein
LVFSSICTGADLMDEKKKSAGIDIALGSF